MSYLSFSGLRMSEQLCEEGNPDYNKLLYKEIKLFFIHYVPAVEMTDLSCISTKLTIPESQKVKHTYERSGSVTAARELLDHLHVKPDWFPAVLEAFDSPHLKLSGFKQRLLEIKRKVDKQWRGMDESSSATQGLPRSEAFPERALGVNKETLPQLRRIPTLQEPNKDDKDGVITNSYERVMSSVKGYCGPIERLQAEDLLHNKRPDSFLVRFNAEQDHYSLSVRGQRKLNHVKICKEGGNGGELFHLENCTKRFDSLASLVDHFSRAAITLEQDSPVCLVYPVSGTTGHSSDETVPQFTRVASRSKGAEVQEPNISDGGVQSDFKLSQVLERDVVEESAAEERASTINDADSRTQSATVCSFQTDTSRPNSGHPHLERGSARPDSDNSGMHDRLVTDAAHRPTRATEHRSLRTSISHQPQKDFDARTVTQELSHLHGWSDDQEEKQIIDRLKRTDTPSCFVMWYWALAKRPTICIKHGGRIVTFLVHKSASAPLQYYINRHQKRCPSLAELMKYHLQNGILHEKEKTTIMLTRPCNK